MTTLITIGSIVFINAIVAYLLVKGIDNTKDEYLISTDKDRDWDWP